MAFGGLVLFSAAYVGDGLETSTYIFGLIMGSLFFLGGFVAALWSRAVLLDSASQRVTLRYGLLGFEKEVTVSADNLSVEMAADTVMRGYTSLRLVSRRGGGVAISLASARGRSSLMNVYEKLAAWLGGEGRDKTLEAIATDSGKTARVSTAAIEANCPPMRTRTLVISASDRAVIRTSGIVIAVLVYMAPIVVALVGGMVYLAFTGENATMKLVGASMAALFAATPYILIKALSPGRVVFDRRRGMVTGRPIASEGVSLADCPNLDDVISLQICARQEVTNIQVGYAGAAIPFTGVQLNLVFARPEGGRVVLMTDRKAPRLRKDATRLAAFLNVPLMDYSRIGGLGARRL